MKSKLLFYSILCLLCLSSCESFVDLTSPTIVRQDMYYKTQTDMTQALTGAYGRLRNIYGSFWLLNEMPSDNVEESTMGGGYRPYDCLIWTSGDPQVQARWSQLYAGISSANTVLDRIEEVTMDPDLKEQYIGEAKFLRGLLYFDLVRMWGEVPLPIHEILTEADAYTYLREPVDVVYAQIEKDLSEAASALEVHPPSDIGRATAGSANGILAKVYVTRKQYDKAIPVLEDLINSGKYSLLPVYKDVFDVNNEDHAEVVFAVKYLSTGFREGSAFSEGMAPRTSGDSITSVGDGGGNNAGTEDLFVAFEAGDKRKDVSIQRWDETGLFYTRKFIDRPPATMEGNNDYMVLRYADILLLYAEALNEMGRTVDAEGPLNKIRTRAGLASISGLDEASMRLTIEQDRRVELCFEGHRWHDLVRTGRMVAVMSAYKENWPNAFQTSSYMVSEEKCLYPVPLREIQLNPNLTQNKGY